MGVYDFDESKLPGLDDATFRKILNEPAAPYVPPPPPPPEESGYLGGTLKSLVRGITEIPIAAGNALEWNEEAGRTEDDSKWNFVNRAGQVISDTAERVRDFIPPAESGNNRVKQSIFGGVESLPLSLAYAIPSTVGAVAAGAAATPETFGAATIPAALAGAAGGQALSSGIMFRSTAQQTLEQLKKQLPDADPNALIDAAKKAGHKEWQGEAISDIPEALIFSRIPGLKAGADTVKALLKPGVKQFAKNVALSMPGEQVGEGYTSYGQAQAMNEVLPENLRQKPWDAVKDTVGPTAVMTLLMAGLGTGVQRYRANGIVNVLENANADPVERGKAAGTVYGLIKEANGEEAARNFLQHAYQAIGDEATTGTQPYAMNLSDPALMQPPGLPSDIAEEGPLPDEQVFPNLPTPTPAFNPPAPSGPISRALSTTPEVVTPEVLNQPALPNVRQWIPPDVIDAEFTDLNVPRIEERKQIPWEGGGEQSRIPYQAKGATSDLPQMQEQNPANQAQMPDVRDEEVTRPKGLREVIEARQREREGVIPDGQEEMRGQGEGGQVIPDHVARAVEEPREVPTSVGVATKQQTKETLNAKLSNGEVAPGSPIRLTTVEELSDILNTGKLREGRDFEGRSGISAQVVDGKKPIVAYGPNDRISAAIVFPKESARGKGESANEVKVDANTDPKSLRFVIDGHPELLTYEQLQEAIGGKVDSQQREAETEKAEVGKEPWEMTREGYWDWTRTNNSSYKRNKKEIEGNPQYLESAKKYTLDDLHRGHVKQALSEGKPVPPEVLAEYPDLAPKRKGVRAEEPPKPNADAARFAETRRKNLEKRLAIARNGRERESIRAKLKKLRKVDRAAHEAATSPHNDLPEPTQAEKEAGNYKMGHTAEIHGLDISIENPAGSVRSGVSPDGKKWKTELKHHYGYIRGTVGKDKDHIDVFIGENPDSRKVFIVNQIDPETGRFDEHKVMLGFDSEAEARKGYLANYDSTGKDRIGSIVEMDIDDSKAWLKNGDTKKAAEQEKKSPEPQNAIFTEDAYQKARARMKAKLSQLNAGFDPELLQDGITIAGYHLERGARKFADYTKAMVDEFGDAIRPYLKAFYNGVRDLPSIEWTSEMDDYQTVQGASVEKSEARPLGEIKEEYAEVRTAWERDKSSPQHLSDRMTELRREAWDGYKIEEGELIEYAHEYGAKSDDIPTLKKRIAEVEKKLEKLRYHATTRAQATTREARASWLAEELGSLTRQLRKAEEAQQKRDLAPTESAKIPVIDRGKGKPAQKSPEQELYDRATEAHAHVSMNPAVAAKVWRDGMVSAAEELRESLEKIAKSGRQKEAIAAQVNLFKQGYVEHARPILSAISRQVSSMVAGKSQFSKNHDKRNSGAQSAEQKANDAFTKWQKEAKEYARQAILNARTPEEVKADEQAAADEVKRAATAKHNKELSIVKQWMALKPGDMVDVGGNGKVAIAKKNRKSIETEGGAKWTITELLGIESKKADELMAEAEAEIVSDTPFTLASHDSLFKRLRDGEPASVDEVKKGFDSLIESEEAIKAELQAMKKDDLLKRMGRFVAGRYKNEKKDVIVSAIYRGMVTDFAYLDGSNSLSYGMRDKVSDVVRKRVEKLTEEGLKKYAEAVAKERDDYKTRVEGYVKAIKNPETWEEFQKYRELGYKIEDLPPEKLKLYDELKAERNREQKAREAEKKATVSQVGTDVEMTLKETTHTKKGTPLFVVQLSDRVERDVYNELNAAAKKLGGYYSSFRGAGAVPGFQFKAREDAEKFMAIREGDVSRADKLEEKAEERQGKKVSKLRAVAESLKEKAEEQLSRDRLTNTARRARQANGAEESARSDIQLAETMLNLADAIESGEATHLDGVAAKTHVETLKGLLRSAKYAYEKAKDIPYIDSKNRTITEDDVDFAKYPYPAQHESHIRDLATFLKDKKGAAMDAAWLGKMAKERAHDSIVSFIQPGDIERLESILAKTKRFIKDGSAKRAIENIADRMQDYNRLQRMGIPDLPSLRAALREFLKFRAGRREADKAKQLERDLVGKKVGVDFFPTPPELAGRMVEIAGVEPGMRVLEPSAGNGNIAEAIRDAGAEPDVAEISPSLREVLEAKGFAVVGQDFMDVDGEYDAIIMNPPFSDNQDIEHVRHAFDLLKPGGRLVAIMGEGAFFRGGKTENAFREWIDEQGAEVEKLPEGTFTDKRLLNTTGVNARLVVVKKEGAEASQNALQAVTEAVADTPAEVVQDAVKSAREAGVSLKEQKKFLLENIEEAIKAAPKERDWKAFNPIAKNREAAESDYDNARKRKESLVDEINSLERNIKEGKVGDTELTEKEIREYREELSELRPQHGEAGEAVQTAKAKLDGIKAKIRDKFMVTIEVPNDGTFDVFNTKEDLRKFKEQVSKQFPSAEKPSSTKGYGNPPKPTGVKAEGLEGGAVIPTNDGVWHTNGYIAVKGEPTIKFKSISENIRSDLSREEGTGMMARITPKPDTGNPVTSVEFAAGRGVMTDNADFRATSDAPIKTAKDEVGYVRLTTESGFSAILSQKLYVYAKQAYPNAEIRVKNENEPVIFVESGDVVAVVMPIRNGGKDGYFEEKGSVTRSVSPTDMEAIANNGLQDEVVSDAPVSSMGGLSKEDVADILRKESIKLVEVKGVFSDDLRRIAKAFGQEIAFYSPLRDRERGGDKEEAGRGMGSGGHTNGFVVNDAGARVVFLNTDSKSPLGFVLAHELTHRLQYEREEDYRLLAERLANAADMSRLFEYLDRQQTINPADSGTQLYGEFVANLVGERFLSKSFWNTLAQKEPSVFRRIADIALRIIGSIKKLFLESPTASSVVTDMAKAEKYIADAMRGFAGEAERQGSTTKPRFSRSNRVVNPDSGLGDVVIAPAESSKEIGGILGQEEGNLKQVSVKGGNSDALRSIAKLFGKEVVFFADMAALESESETPLLHPEGVERNTYPGTDETGKGVQAGILEGKEAAAGIVNPRHPQYIFLNIGSPNHLFFILGHELSHTLRIDDKQLWTQMAKELQPLVRRWGEYRGRLNQHHLPEDEQAEELFGDIMGHNFADEQFWADIAKESPSLFKRIAARAIEIVNKIFDVTFDTDISPFVSDMRQARAIVAMALSKYAQGAEAGLYDKYASEFDGRQNRHSRFHIRQSFSTAAALNHLRTLDPKAALGGLKDFINPLDWSRYAKGVSEMTPQAVQEAVGYFFANPVFQAERDPDKQPFVKSGLEREQNKVDLLLKMFGWDGSKEKAPKLMERLTRTFTRWQNDDITTSWGRIMDSFQKLSAKDRKGVDWLLYRGDADGVSYKTYDMVKDSAKVAKRLPSEAAFNTYRQIRDHIDTVVAQVIEDQTRKFMFEAGLPEEEIEKHITDYRNQLNRMPGWMPRSHGEGDWQVNVYHHITRLKWQVSGGRAFLPFFPSQAVADEIEKLATAHGLKYRHLRNGRQLVEVDEKASEKLKKEIRKLKESLEKGAGEMYASTREEIETKISNAERKLVLAQSPPSEQIRRFTNASTGIIGDISTKNALAKKELEAQLKQAREDGESAAEIKRLENEVEKVGDGRIKVKVYMRLQRTERQAGKHVKEVQATLKKHMPENFLDDEYYEVSSKFSDTISEGMYGDMKNDFAMEQAQLKAIEWAANHGEISKEKAASLRHGILQTTAEVLMARGAGSHRIRRASYLIEGYDAENVTDQYHDYMTGTAGMLSKATYAKEQFENFRYANPKVKRWAERYIKDNLRNMGFADSVSGNLRSLAAFTYLGFKVSSMLINATQVYTLGIAELGRHTKRSALKLIMTAQKDIVADSLKAEERELFHSSIWKIQEQETAVNEMSGSREGITGKVSRFMHTLTDKALMPFQEVEMLNRKTMILSAYRAFRADGMREQDAIDKALEVNRAVNFEMSRANLPGFARNPVGRTIYALQSFAWNNWNWVYNRLTSGEKRDMVALLKYAGTLAVIGGAAALPGGDELDKLLRRLTERSIKMDLQKWAREHAHRYGTVGDMLNDFVWHGTGSAVGVNISNALRLQVPFVSPWLQGETLPESSMGVFAGLWQKGANAGRALSKGDMYRGAESLAPEFVSGPMRAYRQYAEGATTMGGKPVFDENGKPIRYSLSDVALRTAGFQPLKQSERTEAAQQGKILSQHWNEERQDLIDAYRIADKDGRRGVMQKIMRFNAGLRESQAAGLVLPIKLSTLQRAVQSKPDRKKAGWLRKTIG